MALFVNGHAHRMAAGRNRPARDHLPHAQIDDGDYVLVFKVDVGLPGIVGRKELRRTSEVDWRIDFSVTRIRVGLESPQLRAVAADCENGIHGSVIDDAVG